MSISVTTREGVFVFKGDNGSPFRNWTFLRRTENGRMKKAKFPRRFDRILQSRDKKEQK